MTNTKGRRILCLVSALLLALLCLLPMACSKDGERKKPLTIPSMQNVIGTGQGFTIAVKRDGTIVQRGKLYDVSGWTNVVSIAESRYHAVGLRRDGTVVACGDNRHGQCEVSDWRDIAQIYGNPNSTALIGLKRDGTLAATGPYALNITGWQKIMLP